MIKNNTVNLRDIQLSSQEDERVALAAILQDPRFISQLQDFQLKVSIFYWKEHQTIYSAILSMYNEKGSIDLYTVANKLKTIGLSKFNDIDIFDYLEILNETPTSKDYYAQYFENVCRWYYLRLADEKFAGGRKKLRENRDKSLVEIVNIIDGVSADVSTVNVSNMDDEIIDLYADGERIIKEIADRKDPMGVMSPFKSFNDMFGMLTHGDAYIFAAQKKTGKSTLLLFLANYLSSQDNIKIIYIDTEMEGWRNVTRNISAETNEKEVYFRNGKFKNDSNRVSKAQKVFDEWGQKKGRLFHMYAAKKDIHEVEAIVKRFHSKHIKEGETLVAIYDYAKVTTEASDTKQEWLIMGEKMMALKDLASSLKRTIVLTACQLNEQNSIASSARISWFASATFYLKKKTPEQLQRHGLEFGNLILEEYVTRSQGEFYEEWVELQQGGESKYIKNAINLQSENFTIKDLGTYKEMIRKITSRGGQLELAKPQKKEYGKMATSEEF